MPICLRDKHIFAYFSRGIFWGIFLIFVNQCRAECKVISNILHNAVHILVPIMCLSMCIDPFVWLIVYSSFIPFMRPTTPFSCCAHNINRLCQIMPLTRTSSPSSPWTSQRWITVWRETPEVARALRRRSTKVWWLGWSGQAPFWTT